MIDVLYEDDCLLALNKPAGVVVHPTYRNASGTILDALQWRARDWPAPQRPSLVSRLDKDTSGLLIVAKTAPVHAAMQHTMRSEGSEKTYLAIVYGVVDVERGDIDLRLSFDGTDRRRVLASKDVGALSVTRFERLACVEARDAGLSLLRCRLMTGRRHQIRVHLAARGWPIVGDAAYGEPHWTTIGDASLASALRTFPRQALHAHRAAFTHPATGVRLEIEAPVPPDFDDLLTQCGLKCSE
ncbi:MAG: RluA family pseudouridine synthase [Acidobacteriia bacterium]|nr:RluA family pseudouridine synthase [Terriglobia bacterium]